MTEKDIDKQEGTIKGGEKLHGGINTLIQDTQKPVGELIDVYDRKHFEKTGELKKIKVVPKKEAHEVGDFHLAGHIWIYNSNGEILIQKRSKNKDSFPGLWDISAAGHISAGEDVFTGSLRELEEELGINIKDKQVNLEHVFDFLEERQLLMRGKHWHNNEYNSVFVFKYDGDIQDLKMQEEEVEALRFIPLAQLEKELQDPELSKNYVLQKPEYYKKLFNFLENRLK